MLTWEPMRLLQEALETHHMLRCSETEDATEMYNAMREGREPVYRGY